MKIYFQHYLLYFSYKSRDEILLDEISLGQSSWWKIIQDICRKKIDMVVVKIHMDIQVSYISCRGGYTGWINATYIWTNKS